MSGGLKNLFCVHAIEDALLTEIQDIPMKALGALAFAV